MHERPSAAIFFCEYESDLRSNEHYLGSSENKALKNIQACTECNDLSTVGRALQGNRRGHGFKSCAGLNFFQALFSPVLK